MRLLCDDCGRGEAEDFQQPQGGRRGGTESNNDCNVDGRSGGNPTVGGHIEATRDLQYPNSAFGGDLNDVGTRFIRIGSYISDEVGRGSDADINNFGGSSRYYHTDFDRGSRDIHFKLRTWNRNRKYRLVRKQAHRSLQPLCHSQHDGG